MCGFHKFGSLVAASAKKLLAVEVEKSARLTSSLVTVGRGLKVMSGAA
jgi:hypothetical protein